MDPAAVWIGAVTGLGDRIGPGSIDRTGPVQQDRILSGSMCTPPWSSAPWSWAWH